MGNISQSSKRRSEKEFDAFKEGYRKGNEPNRAVLAVDWFKNEYK